METKNNNIENTKLSLAKSERAMIDAAKSFESILTANLFAKNFADFAAQKRREILAVFFNERTALKKCLGEKNAQIFTETCKDVFSGLYSAVNAETFKACRADAVEAYKAAKVQEKMQAQAEKVDNAVKEAARVAGLSEEQAAALLAAGLLKF